MFNKGKLSSIWQLEDLETGYDHLLVKYEIEKVVSFSEDMQTMDSSYIMDEIRKDILKDMDVPDVLYLCDREDPNCKKDGCSKNGGPCGHTDDIRHAVNFKKINGAFNTYVETYDKVYPNASDKKCPDCGEPLHDLVVSYDGEEIDIHVAYEPNPKNCFFYFCPKCHKVYIFKS